MLKLHCIIYKSSRIYHLISWWPAIFPSLFPPPRYLFWKLWVPYEFPRVKKHQLMKFGIFFAAQVSTKNQCDTIASMALRVKGNLATVALGQIHRSSFSPMSEMFGWIDLWSKQCFFWAGRIGSGTYKIVIWKKSFAVNWLCQDFKVVSIDALTKWQPSNKHSLPSHAQKFARTYTFSSIN